MTVLVPGGRSAQLRWRAAGAGLDRARLELSPIGLMVAASMPPDEWQAGFLSSGAHAASTNDIYVNTSRQAGKSTSSAALAAWLAWRRRMLILIVSPTLRQSVELGVKVRSYLPYLPVKVGTESKLEVAFANGSRIVCLPGKPETVRGYSPDLIIADEAAWIADELYEALSPARARTGGRLIALSTPGAPEGWFYSGWSSAGESIERVEVPWTQVSGLSAEIVEAERSLMPEARWRAEFLCEFLRPAGQVFDTSKLAGMVTHEMPDWMTAA